MNIHSVKMAHVLAGIAIVLAFFSSADAQSVPATQPAGKVFGWRGDGNGRYPDANPPTDWGRTAKSVKELSAQAAKPKDDAPPAKEAAIPDGVIRNWLVLGPLPMAEDKKLEEILPGVEGLSPDADEKAGDSKWQPFTMETGCLDLCAALNVGPKDKGFAAYAHTYIYSPSGQPVGYNVLYQGQGSTRVWLNGVQIYDGGKNPSVGVGVRLALQLKKGWNRLLVLNTKVQNDRRSWWLYGGLYGDKGAEFDTRGIVWATRTPEVGASSPVMAGDRIFLTFEGGGVTCINKADGKVLWVRSLTYYDFATDEDRKANPELFKDLDELAAKVKKLDETDCIMPWKAPTLEKDMRSVIEGQIFRGMQKVSKERYNNPATWGCESGWTPCTPVTDGQRVYALFGTGIVACYDLDGKLVWKRLLKHTMVEHGYATSPLLVDGKLVIYLDDFTVLDPKTGEVILERPHYAPPKPLGPSGQFFGTGSVLQAGNEKVVHYQSNEFVRLSDGKSLTVDAEDYKKFNPGLTTGLILGTPVIDNGTVYKVYNNEGGVMSFKLAPLQGDKVVLEANQVVPFNTDKFPYFYENFYCASTLLHEGLLYCVNDFGVLTVVDMAKGEVAYQKHLDLDIYMPYNQAGYLKGGATASPTLGGKYIYIWGNQGTCLVIQPGRTYKQIARNRLENQVWPDHPGRRQEATTTEPIFEGDRMYYRGEYTLYCIGAK
jgi:outer membrane protein assembly factor BamB